MSNLRLKQVLELMMPDIVREQPQLLFTYPDEKEESDEYFAIKKRDIVSLDMQKKVLNRILPLMCEYEEGDGYYSLPCEPAEPQEEIEVKDYNFFLMSVNCEVWTDTLMYKSLHIRGFDTYYELKSYIDTTYSNFSIFRVYAKALDEYRRVDFKGDYDEESGRWSDFSIPSIAEFFPVSITNKDYNIVLPYSVGIIPTIQLYKEYVSFVFSDIIKKNKPFNISGYVAYENKKYKYNVRFDGLKLGVDFEEKQKSENN